MDSALWGTWPHRQNAWRRGATRGPMLSRPTPLAESVPGVGSMTVVSQMGPHPTIGADSRKAATRPGARPPPLGRRRQAEREQPQGPQAVSQVERQALREASTLAGAARQSCARVQRRARAIPLAPPRAVARVRTDHPPRGLRAAHPLKARGPARAPVLAEAQDPVPGLVPGLAPAGQAVQAQWAAPALHRSAAQELMR